MKKIKEFFGGLGAKIIMGFFMNVFVLWAGFWAGFVLLDALWRDIKYYFRRRKIK